MASAATSCAPRPDYVPALGLRGVVAAVDGDAAVAIPLLERACAAQPGNAGWLSTLGEMYRMLNLLDPALVMGATGDAAEPAAGRAHGPARQGLCRPRRAGRGDDPFPGRPGAGAREPQRASWHRAGAACARRVPGRRWIEYEWRNKMEQAQGRFPPIRAPLWSGMRHDRGGRILLIGDQGFGDTLQFARYIPLVAERCSEVLLGLCTGSRGRCSARYQGWDGFSANGGTSRVSPHTTCSRRCPSCSARSLPAFRAAPPICMQTRCAWPLGRTRLEAVPAPRSPGGHLLGGAGLASEQRPPVDTVRAAEGLGRHRRRHPGEPAERRACR